MSGSTVGWKTVRLGDVVKLKNGYAFKSKDYVAEGTPVIRISDINDDKVSADKAVRVSQENVNSNFFIEPGDLLIAMSGATTGKTGVYSGAEPVLQNQRVGNFKILDQEIVDEKYRNYFISSLRKDIEAAAYGGAQPNISAKVLDEFEFPLAPIEIQRSIVAEIEKQFSRLDEAVASLKRVKANLKRYKAAVLKAAVEGKLIASDESFELLGMSELGTLHCGQSPASKDVNSEGIGTLYVTGPEQWDGHKVHQSKWTNDPRRIVPDGCIFVTVKGSGVGTLFPGIACAIGRDVYAFEPNDRCLSGYVELALQASINDVLRHASGDIPGLSKRHILDHRIGVPSIKVQEEILVRVDEVLSSEKVAAESVGKDLIRLERLRQSALSRAFKAEIQGATGRPA